MVPKILIFGAFNPEKLEEPPKRKKCGSCTGDTSRTGLAHGFFMVLRGVSFQGGGLTPRFFRKNGGYLQVVGSEGTKNMTLQTVEGSVCSC